MTSLVVHVEGIGLLGPGLGSWDDARARLAGVQPWVAAPTAAPSATLLPPTERRRAGTAVRLAIAVANEAVRQSGRDAATLASVFTASGADGDNCHAICAALASDDRQLSPTRFHNSVHNAPAGYWGIAVRSRAPSTTLCAYDASFGAGLLEAAVQVATTRAPVLLVAYDTAYPSPLHEARPIPDAFGVACVLAPQCGPRTLARVAIEAAPARPDACSLQALEPVRRSIPAARCLPLLEAIAAGRDARVALEYLAPLAVVAHVEVVAPAYA